jgi:hypothetical protein
MRERLHVLAKRIANTPTGRDCEVSIFVTSKAEAGDQRRWRAMDWT